MNDELAARLLEQGTRSLEATSASTGRVNLAAARAVGDASLLLGHSGLAKRCERFLRGASAQSFWAGVITNVDVNRESVPDAARSLTPIDQIQRNHPTFSENYSTDVMTAGMGDHIGPCAVRDYGTAFENAGPNEFRWHEVVAAQAVNGDMSLALPKLDDVNSRLLRRHLQLVFAIESFRRGNVTVGSKMHSQLETANMDEWTATHLAVGVANRVPWLCYPFADF